MHPVLLIDEVLRIILDHIDHDLNRLPAFKTFYHLAIVCRAWKDPALDYLWASLSSVDPLLALLPHVSILLVTHLAVLTKSEHDMRYRMHHVVISPLMLLHDFMPTLRGSEMWVRVCALYRGACHVPTLRMQSPPET
jgi:hypothetical protein